MVPAYVSYLYYSDLNQKISVLRFIVTQVSFQRCSRSNWKQPSFRKPIKKSPFHLGTDNTKHEFIHSILFQNIY